MKRALLIFILTAFSQVLLGQNVEMCSKLSSGGVAVRTKDVPYTATAYVDGQSLTSIHRFNVFYSSQPSASGSIVRFKVISANGWAIAKGAEVSVTYSDGVVAKVNTMEDSSPEEVGTFYQSSISFIVDDGRLIHLNDAASVSVKTSEGPVLEIRFGDKFEEVFSEVYMEMWDELSAKGWTKTVL